MRRMPVKVVCGQCLRAAQCQDASKIEAFGLAFLRGEGNVHRCAKHSQHGASCKRIGRLSREELEQDGDYMARERVYKSALRATLRTHLKRVKLEAPANLEELLDEEVGRRRETAANSAVGGALFRCSIVQ